MGGNQSNDLLAQFEILLEKTEKQDIQMALGPILNQKLTDLDFQNSIHEDKVQGYLENNPDGFCTFIQLV